MKDKYKIIIEIHSEFFKCYYKRIKYKAMKSLSCLAKNDRLKKKKVKYIKSKLSITIWRGKTV